jgi:hypothetical protein
VSVTEYRELEAGAPTLSERVAIGDEIHVRIEYGPVSG